jgi:hypothetical protein
MSLDVEDSSDLFQSSIKANFNLEQAMKAQRGNRDIALLFL